ncbi:hypothetical protein JAB6_11090 [Janthinobacterium sp. HH104]|uniref:hypothetical protein n=1 Tax=Janthinobacterium sp. HH104 TaxID=1537276 RepID=UPI0008752A88|nr:hypothetical protein [Janthinobacterium sp. HH104]OEZ87178.1 hypothetical protein JAB6_11090 [Janthinobacterium sp. HH104]
MAKRDPNVTARNRAITEMTEEMKLVQTACFAETGRHSEASLNAFIGSKADDFIDLKHEIITTPEHYIHLWIAGMEKTAKKGPVEIQDFLKDATKLNFKKYVSLFLRRSFLKHYNELCKKRPETGDSEIWFGVNDAHYGLFVTPRWNGNAWENDRSEIRGVSFKYWTIGHVLKTGLCIPDDEERYFFSKKEDYLAFLKGQARITKSKYQLQIVEKYIEMVLASESPLDIPLLIPELRFDGSGRKHKHRLDFFIINPFTMEKIGFEISPWSTHGKLAGKDKTLIQLNKEALANFEAEVHKARAYYKKFKIPVLHYTDTDLQNIDEVFEQIAPFLDPGAPPKQMEMGLFAEYFGGVK